MSTKFYWITKTIGIMPRLRGNEWLEDEIIAGSLFNVAWALAVPL